MAKRSAIIMRVFLWLILAVILGFFVYFKIVPAGAITYVYDFGRPSYFIGKLTPAERVETEKTEAVIKGGPVYFSLKTPRRFTQAKVTVKFKNTTDFPIMEIGPLNNKAAWSYDLKPLQNKIIDQLALAWPAAFGENGAKLIEREKKYDTVERFLSNLPPRDEVALYDYSLKNNFLLDGYEPGRRNNQIDYKFRGSYQFYTYLKQEELDYLFNFTDLNVNEADDPVEIKVYSEDGEIYSAYLADGRADNGERRAAVKIAGLPEGVYRFSVIANDDIVTENIASRQDRFVLINKIWLAGGNKKNLVLFTDSRSISAQTANPASLGKIKIGASALNLSETYRQAAAKTLSRPAEIELPKDDIIISGDGVFSLTESGLFNPKFKSVDGNLDINGEKINYVLTNYQAPVSAGGWQTAAAEFDLTKAYQENGKYQFLISIPSFKAEEPAEGEMIIKEIKIDLKGTSLWQKFKKYYAK